MRTTLPTFVQRISNDHQKTASSAASVSTESRAAKLIRPLSRNRIQREILIVACLCTSISNDSLGEKHQFPIRADFIRAARRQKAGAKLDEETFSTRRVTPSEKFRRNSGQVIGKERKGEFCKNSTWTRARRKRKRKRSERVTKARAALMGN